LKLYFILVTSISYLAGQVSIVAARYGSVIIAVLTVTAIQGRSQTFSFGGGHWRGQFCNKGSCQWSV